MILASISCYHLTDCSCVFTPLLIIFPSEENYYTVPKYAVVSQITFQLDTNLKSFFSQTGLTKEIKT